MWILVCWPAFYVRNCFFVSLKRRESFAALPGAFPAPDNVSVFIPAWYGTKIELLYVGLTFF